MLNECFQLSLESHVPEYLSEKGWEAESARRDWERHSFMAKGFCC